MRIIGGFSDTRENNEDFVITPYIFAVWMRGEVVKVYGIGVCWAFMSGYIALGFNIPKDYPSFKRL